MLGLAVVDGSGEEVSRLRGFLRALVAWAPVAVPYVWLPDTPAVPPMFWWSVAVGGAIFLTGATWAALHPQRGLQDHIAGTYLVPR